MASERAAHAFTDLKKLHREMGHHLYAIAADVLLSRIHGIRMGRKERKAKEAHRI